MTTTVQAKGPSTDGWVDLGDEYGNGNAVKADEEKQAAALIAPAAETSESTEPETVVRSPTPPTPDASTGNGGFKLTRAHRDFSGGSDIIQLPPAKGAAPLEESVQEMLPEQQNGCQKFLQWVLGFCRKEK